MSFRTIFLVIGLFLGAPAQGQNVDDLRQEESQDYYEKWLEEDVVYIISEEERDVFENLSTQEEKEQFIEQFWFRRDPNPSTAQNEFKEEHYRRIAYANERFSSGLPGWMTDRGRIYIMHGEPAEIESHPTGGIYERPLTEGGGTTSTFPFEIWRYRHIPGLGSDIILEFVDPSLSGEYRLALTPEEKDALLYVPGAGQTLAEQMGLASKGDRPFFSPGNRDTYPLMYQRARDNPFARYETYALVQRAPEIKYKDLQEIVEINVGYSSLPITVSEDYFRLNDSQSLVPVTVQLENKNLTFKKEAGRHIARVAIYGLVTSITNRVVTEFEDDVVVSYAPEDLERGLLKSSLYQKVLPLDSKLRYKLDLVVKDLNSSQVGTKQIALAPPRATPEDLYASSFLLADTIRLVPEVSSEDEMFVLGDVKVRPSLSKEFPVDSPLGLYFQLYNVAIDQSTFEPALEVRWELYRDGERVRHTTDSQGESTQFFSGQRVVMIKLLSLEGLPPGEYQVKVQIEDRLGGQSLELSDRLEIVDYERLARN